MTSVFSVSPTVFIAIGLQALIGLGLVLDRTVRLKSYRKAGN